MKIFPSKSKFQKFSGKLKPCWTISNLKSNQTQTFTLNLFEQLKQKESVLLFSGKRGRYSILGLQPFLIFKSKNGQSFLNKKTINKHPLTVLRQLFQKYNTPKVTNLPPFYAGAIGMFGYETFELFEKIPKAKKDDLNLPTIYLLFFDEIIIIDHLQKKQYLIGTARTFKKAKSKVKNLKNKLQNLNTQNLNISSFSTSKKNLNQKIYSNFSKKAYFKAITKVKQALKRGETFQVNLSQRLETKQIQPSYQIFKKLSQINPSPFAVYLETPKWQIVSCSPERLVRLKNGKLFTQPIAGTRKRNQNQKKDQHLANELKNSTKEMAEHTMLVDLLRNDLGKISNYGSVLTKNFAHIEKYSHVQHLVSNISGKLKKELDIFDVIQALFPGGTITGAPKFKTMEIISALEPTQRGPYTGSLGYLGFNGNADLNILIRTIVCVHQKMYIQVGGGIVMDSIASNEYQETWEKAKAMLEAVNLL